MIFPEFQNKGIQFRRFRTGDSNIIGMHFIRNSIEKINITVKGADALNEKDTLIIFYSNSCEKIRYDAMQEIRESGCGFRVIKRKKAGKKQNLRGANLAPQKF